MTEAKLPPAGGTAATVSGRNYHSALARLLVDQAARTQLLAAPEATAARFGLTAAELRQLTAIDPGRLEASAGGILRARTRALRRLLSIAFRLYGAAIEASAAAFLIADIPPASGDEAARSLATGWRFAAFLAAGGIGRPAAAEIVRLELLRAELLLSGSPGRPPREDRPPQGQEQAVQNGCGLPSPAAGIRPALAAHVRLGAFRVNVLTPRPGQDPVGWDTPDATYVLLARPAGQAAVRLSRLTRAAFDVLSQCDGSRTVAEVGQAVNGRHPSRYVAPDEVSTLVSSALREGLLQVG